MHHQYYIGAINKDTDEYVHPTVANKTDQHICPDCEKDVILVKGEIRAHHFRHKADSNPCNLYNHPGESQIHKYAKPTLKSLIEEEKIEFTRDCVRCDEVCEIIFPEITENSRITLEHRFNYKENLRIADVAHIINGEIKAIFEVCKIHQTCSENRPEPWVEVEAKSVLTLTNTNNELLRIKCIRPEKCDKCAETGYKKKYCGGCKTYGGGNCDYCGGMSDESYRELWNFFCKGM
uniref:Competence protein CoiA-like N-terminal domain-containing protein n=1 Tax=viral metagenome TaxID=1070528 RepID=A0A6C0IJU8_9ZZZZ